MPKMKSDYDSYKEVFDDFKRTMAFKVAVAFASLTAVAITIIVVFNLANSGVIVEQKAPICTFQEDDIYEQYEKSFCMPIKKKAFYCCLDVNEVNASVQDSHYGVQIASFVIMALLLLVYSLPIGGLAIHEWFKACLYSEDLIEQHYQYSPAN